MRPRRIDREILDAGARRPLGDPVGEVHPRHLLVAELRETLGDDAHEPGHRPAELGAVGVLSFVAFLAGAAALLRYAMRAELPFGLAAVGVFVALFTHALFYSGFFENPTMWGTLAAAAALRATRGEQVTQAASRAVAPASGA